MFDSKGGRNAVVALVAVRLVYAVNWLNIGAIFVLMEPDLGGGVGGLGTITSAFYLGLGIFQIPGGILAAAWGPKRVVTIGVLASSLAVLGTALSAVLLESALFRFVAGAGMAFVFAPAVVIVAKMLKGKRSGLGVGLYNSAFDVGALAGLFAWVVIADVAGWRASLMLSGALGVMTGLLAMVLVPRDIDARGAREAMSHLWEIVGDSHLLLVGLGTLATDIGVALAGSFVVYFMVGTLGTGAAPAGFIGSFVFSVGIVSNLWGGRLYDRIRSPRLLMGVSNAFVALGLFLFAVGLLPVVFAAALIVGAASGIAFTVAFATGRDLNKSGQEYGSLAVAWVNCIGLFGAFWPPLLFSYLAEVYGYSSAWVAGGLLVLAFTAPMVVLGVRKPD